MRLMVSAAPSTHEGVDMTMQQDQIASAQAPESTAAAGTATASQEKPTHRAITDPREVAGVVMARMNLVTAKKDELSMAINGLVDMTQQLTRVYSEQLLAIEQLRRRVKDLEAKAAAAETSPAPTVQ